MKRATPWLSRQRPFAPMKPRFVTEMVPSGCLAYSAVASVNPRSNEWSRRAISYQRPEVALNIEPADRGQPFGNANASRQRQQSP